VSIELLADSICIQVLRYSALGAGIFYGLYRQASLSASAKLAAIDREYEHKQSLIEKAKAEYTKKNMPASAKTEGGGSTFDPVFPKPLASNHKVPTDSYSFQK
jgi:F-type H+-transporting ATP synthase subunit e